MFTKKNLFIHFFFLVLSAGMIRYNLQRPNLIWNMFLALVAFDLAVLANCSKQNILKLFAAILWLFFYPNTFYMVTDITHMHFTSTVLWERESMILFMLYVPSILFGVMAGVESLKLIFSAFSIKAYWIRLLIFCTLSLLSSIAIHIGRYARLNSWDIFTRPITVVNEMIAAISWAALPFISGFTILQIMVLVFSADEY
ncbi:DUF1361 domain-containing protein [Streptococcus ruminantium]|uniref:DUF1361 domain-containing protein n=1 Tax=Streptococcus ruminantium TaxID=1917441 RepID=A0A2Z5TLM7_9STRE|nr:DUF1361 domain-containing protein [Streptococcus ruminantium]MDQ8758921.1 DUF1361 domain-containing protein [Streptococcus ruminantium]MDQ8764138.1 DUF1361 domain-containing protein [Streptococcus ruminantium]MDQ8766566.1 DUF1361 domain-containing protein [Streptococcus ruminantium]MDQ8768750.1 DUF1361 domain-containing protein [Streptococcus ruminantium]MDQ8774220.1 DUF1361 domain-containing protein [Streptococcus ruminantium]